MTLELPRMKMLSCYEHHEGNRGRRCQHSVFHISAYELDTMPFRCNYADLHRSVPVDQLYYLLQTDTIRSYWTEDQSLPDTLCPYVVDPSHDERATDDLVLLRKGTVQCRGHAQVRANTYPRDGRIVIKPSAHRHHWLKPRAALRKNWSVDIVD